MFHYFSDAACSSGTLTVLAGGGFVGNLTILSGVVLSGSSFGSGKSHFMAVLHLLLNGHPAARGLPRLTAALRLRTPESRLSDELGGLLRCFAFRSPLPSLSPPQWALLAALLLQARAAAGHPAGLAAEMAAPDGASGWAAVEVASGLGAEELRALRELLRQDPCAP